MVTCALFAGNAEFDAAGARVLRAEGLVPHFDGEVCLEAQGFGETRRASSRRVGTVCLVKGLADKDKTRSVFGGQRGHLRGVQRARGVRDHRQRGGDGGGWVAEGESDALSTVVNSEDTCVTHISPPEFTTENTEITEKNKNESLWTPCAPW